MTKRKFPRKALRAPFSESRSTPEPGAGPITVTHRTASDTSSDEFSALADILKAASAAESSASIRDTQPSPRNHTDWDPSSRLSATERAPRAELSALVGMLTSVIGPEAPVPTHENPSPSYPARFDMERVELPDPSPSGGVSIHDAAALRYVGRSLATIESCITLQAHSPGVLMPLAVRHVLKAEMARAAGLLQLLRFLKNDFSPVTKTVFTSVIMQRVLHSAESERCLRGISLASRSSVDVTLEVDDTLLANLLLGVLLTTFVLLDGVENPQVYLVVTGSDEGEVSLSVRQEQATAPYGWPTHPVAEAWTDAAGGVLSAIAMSAGDRIAEAWRGRFIATVAERSTSISISLPVRQLEHRNQSV